MAVAVQSLSPQMTSTLDALWTLIQSQPKKVRAALTQRILQQDVEAETMRQQMMVKNDLTIAVNELKDAKKNGKRLKTAEEFLSELE